MNTRGTPTPALARHVLWCLIPALGNEDRAMVLILNSSQWVAFRPANDITEVRECQKYLPPEGRVM